MASSGGSGGGMSLIGDVVLGSTTASITISSIPGTYRHLYLIVQGRLDSAAFVVLGMQFNGDTAANYDYEVNNTAGGTDSLNQTLATSQIRIGAIGAQNVGDSGIASVVIPNYARTDFHKIVVSDGAGRTLGTYGDFLVGVNGGTWRNTAAITSVKVFPTSGSFVSGSSATLWGLQ